MAKGHIRPVLRALSRAAQRDASVASDSVLLQRFVDGRDETAFAALVARHDGLVLGVCRRVLHDEQDAEDARQAAFLILLRKAGSITKAGSLASWLHGVAFRVAVKLRAARSRARCAPLTDVPSPQPAADLSLREAQALLDDELRKLPERLRQPLVLCYLEGKTRDEAAAELGWSIGTVRGRLERGRTRLRDRLRRRGVEFPGLLLPALLASHVGAACLAGAGGRLSSLSHNHRALGLAEGVLYAMSLEQCRRVLSACLSALTLAVLMVGVGWTMRDGTPVAAADQQPTGSQTSADGAPKQRLKAGPAVRGVDPDREFGDKVRKCMDRGIAWLRKQRNAGGTWENSTLTYLQPGGTTALAVLALLDAGVRPDDRDLIPAINFLRQLEPQHTYVVGLQTAVFARINEKKDTDLLRRNVAWLEKATVRVGGTAVGWGYTQSGQRPDNSNTQYAVLGLYEAHRAGFKVSDKGLWKEVRAHFVSTQHNLGGWGYIDPVAATTHTMTLAALCCLSICDEVLQPMEESTKARERGFVWLGEHFAVTSNSHTYYNLYGIARLGKLSGRPFWDGPRKAKIVWYRKGAEWLLKAQQQDGSFAGAGGTDAIPELATSFALLFLAARE